MVPGSGIGQSSPCSNRQHIAVCCLPDQANLILTLLRGFMIMPVPIWTRSCWTLIGSVIFIMNSFHVSEVFVVNVISENGKKESREEMKKKWVKQKYSELKSKKKKCQCRMQLNVPKWQVRRLVVFVSKYLRVMISYYTYSFYLVFLWDCTAVFEYPSERVCITILALSHSSHLMFSHFSANVCSSWQYTVFQLT